MERFPIGAAAKLEELSGDPFALLARLREREPVSWLPVLGGWLVTRRDLALEAMRDPDRFTVDDPRFSTGRVVGPSMLTLEGSSHARHRAPFAGPFRLDRVREGFTGVVRAEVDRLIDGFAPLGQADLRRSFAAPLATRVVTHALGLGGAEVPAVLGWYEAIVGAVTAVTSGESMPVSGPRAFGELSAAVGTVVDRGPESLVGAAAADGSDGGGGSLSRDEVVSNAAVLMFGGIETTEGMIANALLHLLSHPSELALVRAEPELLADAVEESLRLEPAAATIDRYATRDTTFGGAPVRAGDLVTISIAAANRDPAAFDDPDAFDVRRPNARRHLAFAGGPHVCIGMHLARLEAHTALRRVLERLPGLRLASGAGTVAPRGLVFRKPPALMAEWDVR